MVSIFDFGQDGFMQGMNEDQRRQLVSQGLLDFGANMLQNSQARGYTPSFGQGLAAGAQGLGETFRQGQQDFQKNQLMDLKRRQAEAEMEDMQRQREMQERQSELRQGLFGMMAGSEEMSPEQAAMLQAYPEMADDVLQRQYFPEPMSPSERYKSVGGNLFDIGAEGGPQMVYSSPDKPSAREQKIYSLMNQGVDPAEAANIVDGIVRYEQNPIDGSLVRLNQATGETQRIDTEMPPLNLGGPGAPQQQGGAGQALGQASEQAAPQQGGQQETPTILEGVSSYGPEGRIGELAQRGTFGAYDPGQEQTQQRQRIRLLREQILEAYARSGRPSNYAQQRVEELLPSTGVFESPTRAYDQLSEMYREMNQQYNDAQAIYENPGIPPDQKHEAIKSMISTRNVMRAIGDPGQIPRPSERDAPPEITTDQEYEDLPSGTEFIAPDGTRRRKP